MSKWPAASIDFVISRDKKKSQRKGKALHRLQDAIHKNASSHSPRKHLVIKTRVGTKYSCVRRGRRVSSRRASICYRLHVPTQGLAPRSYRLISRVLPLLSITCFHDNT